MSREVGNTNAQAMRGGALALAAMRKRSLVTSAAVLVIACAIALACGLAGCASESDEPAAPREISKTECFPVVVKAGAVSIEMPEGFDAYEEVDMGSRSDNGFGAIDNVVSMATADEGRIMLQLAEVVQKPDSDIVGVNEVKESLEAAPEKVEKYKQSMPEYYESIKDMKRGEPEMVVINGRKALVCENELNGITMLLCVVEEGGSIAASAQFKMPATEYQENKQLYESVLATIDIAA